MSGARDKPHVSERRKDDGGLHRCGPPSVLVLLAGIELATY